MVTLKRCWTGRRWVNIGKGWLAMGFGPNFFIERVWWKYKLVYAKPYGFITID